MSVTRQELLETRTGNYEPGVAYSAGTYHAPSRKPRFNRAFIPFMLAHPHIQLGLKIIRGRIIARSRFYVEESNEETRNFLIRQISRFWMYSANRMLSALAFGYSGAECHYSLMADQIEFRMVKNFIAPDVRVVCNEKGEKVGMTVRRTAQTGKQSSRIYLGGLKSLWHIHNRDIHPWYGATILFGAYDPWFESYKDGGGRDIRNLYFHKYAFSGDTIYYPPGATPDGNGLPRDNRSIAKELVEKRRTGGVLAFPNQRDEAGNQMWTLEPGQVGTAAAPVLEYNEHLKTEILEGMGVPREVVEAAETGSGYSGRAVPLEAFDSTLQDYTNWLIYDFDEQILRPLIRFREGREPTHEIIPFGLARGTESQETLERSANTFPGDSQHTPFSSFPEKPNRTLRNLFGTVFWHD